MKSSQVQMLDVNEALGLIHTKREATSGKL